MIEELESKINSEYNELYNKALKIAFEAHAGQLDKGGMPYVMHPLRVSNKCHSRAAKIVALLHDVIEDSHFTPDDLRAQGFPEASVVGPVMTLTKQKNDPYEDYISCVSFNRIATEVKLADLEDNMDITRLEELTDVDLKRIKKYHRSYKQLKRRIAAGL